MDEKKAEKLILLAVLNWLYVKRLKIRKAAEALKESDPEKLWNSGLLEEMAISDEWYLEELDTYVQLHSKQEDAEKFREEIREMIKDNQWILEELRKLGD